MKVELTLSDEVASYIEYIPKEQLSGILSSLLVEAIKNKSSQKVSTEDINSSNTAISEVMVLLKQMANNSTINENKHTRSVEVKQPVINNVQKKIITSDEADIDLEDDFLDMLK